MKGVCAVGATDVKGRRYDASGRRRASAQRRLVVVEQARRLFLEHGFGGTTVAAVAQAAGVSVETIYKAFGGKAGLVRAVWEQALEGGGPVPAEERSDAVSAVADDPREVVATWARLSAEVGERAAPVLALVRAAAAADPEAAALLAEIDAGRLARMRHNADALARRGHLRPGLSVERAAQLMVAISGSLHDPLVGDAGWSAVEYAEVVERLLTAGLLADRGEAHTP
jgi:AcrR family transcriptional regulator